MGWEPRLVRPEYHRSPGYRHPGGTRPPDAPACVPRSRQSKRRCRPASQNGPPRPAPPSRARAASPVTASSGLPKASPGGLHSDEGHQVALARDQVDFRCPTRKPMRHDAQHGQEVAEACSSPAIPRRWRSSSNLKGRILTPLLTDASYRCADGDVTENYAGRWPCNAECGVAECGMSGVSVARRIDLSRNSGIRIPHSALSGSADSPSSSSPTNTSSASIRSLVPGSLPAQLVDDPRRRPYPMLMRRWSSDVERAGLDADLGGLAEQGIALAGGALLPLSAASSPAFAAASSASPVHRCSCRHGAFAHVPCTSPSAARLVGRDEGLPAPAVARSCRAAETACPVPSRVSAPF